MSSQYNQECPLVQCMIVYIDEHDVIMDEVISISANLGLALRLRPGDLDRVHEENQRNTQNV